MKKLVVLFICVLTLQTQLLSQEGKLKHSSDTISLTTSKTNYFDQNPPGLTPEIFAPGIISLPNRNESFASFSSSTGDFYFTVNDTIYYTSFNDGTWKQPEIATFLGKKGMGKYLRISPNGRTVIVNNDGDLYVNNLQDDEWGKAIKLAHHISSDEFECVGSMASDRSMYFGSHREGSKGQCDIYFCKYKNGKYEAPVNIEGFNTSHSECNVLISPANDFIIFTSYGLEGGYGSTDMYISYAQNNGEWSTPKNLGDQINTKYADSPYSLTPDGKYFLFGRNNKTGSTENMDIFWVDSKILYE